MAEDDEREEELSSIAAIFPELVIDPANPFAATLDLPVAPSSPLTLHFPTVSLPTPPCSDNEKDAIAIVALQDTHKVEHLPPLHLDIVLPDGYPEDTPPQVTLRTTHDWLPADKILELQDECAKLWEEYGKCQILFSYIDFLQQSAERAFDLDQAGVDLDPFLKPDLLAFDTTTKKHAFDQETFDCGVCLEPKKGSSCYRLTRCRHVFCLSCLQDFYNNCITEGDVVNVKCLDPGCGKDKDGKRKRKERTLHPRELLAMGLEEPVVRRYVEMKRKKMLEADKSTVYCPRTWCQAPARSAKYPPLPADLAMYPDSDTEGSDTDTDGTNTSKSLPMSDRLSICSKCTFAFCRICYSGWHGEFARCWPRNPGELSEEDKASYDYIRLHTSPCPTCSSPTQKTMGCNHMRCFQCNTHFCYLCGAWLQPDNPYMHFNKEGTSCFMKLWELEEGDEGPRDGAAPFHGARMWEEEARRVAEEADREEAMRLQDDENALAAAEEEQHARLIMPEAPNPPPANLDRALLAQLARLQVANEPAPHQHAAAVRNQARQRARAPRGRGGGNAANFWAGHEQRAERGRGRGGGGAGRGRINNAARPQVGEVAMPMGLDPAAAAAFRRFVELAQRDEEDDWDSDELDEDGDEQWEIREGLR